MSPVALGVSGAITKFQRHLKLPPKKQTHQFPVALSFVLLPNDDLVFTFNAKS